MLVPLQGAAARCRCQARLSECCLRFELCCNTSIPLAGRAFRMLFALWSFAAQGAVSKCCLRFGAWLLERLQGAAADGCRVLLSECCCVRFGAWLLVPLQAQGAAVCRLQGAPSELNALCALELSCAGCRCKVLLSKCCLKAVDLGCRSGCRVPLQVAAGSCCQSAVRALELGCWSGCRAPLQVAAGPCCQSAVRFGAWLLVPLQGAAAGCCCSVPLAGRAFRRLFALWSFVAQGAVSKCCLRFGAWLLERLEGAAAGGSRVLLSECCARFGAWLLVPLKGAAAGCWRRNAVRVKKNV